MTLAELQGEVWETLPFTRRVIGRRMVDRIVKRAMHGWPVPVLLQCDERQCAVVAKHYTRTIERQVRGEVQMGFILSIVLATLISEIVKYLVKRWLENRTGMIAVVEESR